MSWMWAFSPAAAAPGAPAAQRTPGPDHESRLADAFVESYVSWREQCAEVESAYERWTSGRDESGVDYAIYLAELEFEEDAAQAYRDSVERLALAIRSETQQQPPSQRGEACSRP